VDFLFQRIRNDKPRSIPQRGNVASSTMYQVARRLFAGHSAALTAKELTDQGNMVSAKEVAGDFTLARILNDNYVEMRFKS
jgi:hypothetical protein